MKSNRTKATDISQKVKQIVWQRDGGRCVVCGNKINTMPNAHFIARSHGGLGIEQNIVTLCSNFTENKCHYKYDFGSSEEHEFIKAKIERYLKSKYPNWNKEDLIYRRK
jgi:5-methylcytosine-specific restriction endonuclease McrA